jgi:hypothetical protein
MPVAASVRVAGRKCIPGADRGGVSVPITAASWLLQRLPGQVLQDQRAELIRTLSEASDLTVEVRCSGAPLVRVRDGARLLVEIPANGAG